MNESQASAARGPRVFRFDLVSKLASSCPCWIVIPNFDCRDYVPTMQFMEASRLVDMFAAKVLNRSTCVVGLLNACRPLLSTMSHVPAAFFRPLEYLLELTDAGIFYRPVTAEDLAAGVPAPHWCLPLHMQLQQQLQPQGPSQVHTQPHTTMQSLAAAALSTCQWWCLVHKYQQSDAKCDFNWQPKDLVAGLISRAVSPYTLVLGLSMHKERNMPWMRSCLFMPLAAVLHQHQSGINYVPLDKDDLDIFNTLGFKGALQSGVLPRALSGSGAAGSTPSAGPSAGGSSSSARAELPALAPPPAARPATRSASQIAASAAKSAINGLGLAGFHMSPAAYNSGDMEVTPRVWSTPVMRLFTTTPPGQTEISPPRTRWWLLEPAQQQLQGPLEAEQVLIAYVQGSVSDETLACGTYTPPGPAQALPPAPPPTERFQPLHVLLAAVQRGSKYRLSPWPDGTQMGGPRRLTAVGPNPDVPGQPLTAQEVLALHLQRMGLDTEALAGPLQGATPPAGPASPMPAAPGTTTHFDLDKST